MDLIKELFPAFVDHPGFFGVLARCLASVVYHFDFLNTNLPSKHRFFSSPLFSSSIIDEMKPFVIHGCKSDFLKATGVPPYSSINRRLGDIEKSLESLGSSISTDLEGMLQRNGAAAANVTPQGISDAIESSLKKLIPVYLEKAQGAKVAVVADPTITTVSVYSWGGSFHKLPQNYKLPDVNVAAAFRIWFLGICAEKLPPFKSLDPSDFSLSNERKRFSDWKCIMKCLIENLANDFLLLDPKDFHVDVINSQYKLASERMPRVEKKKRGRPEEWTIQTALKECRSAKKARLEV